MPTYTIGNLQTEIVVHFKRYSKFTWKDLGGRMIKKMTLSLVHIDNCIEEYTQYLHFILDWEWTGHFLLDTWLSVCILYRLDWSDSVWRRKQIDISYSIQNWLLVLPQIFEKSNCFLLSQGWKFAESWFAVGSGLIWEVGENTMEFQLLSNGINWYTTQHNTIQHDTIPSHTIDPISGSYGPFVAAKHLRQNISDCQCSIMGLELCTFCLPKSCEILVLSLVRMKCQGRTITKIWKISKSFQLLQISESQTVASIWISDLKVTDSETLPLHKSRFIGC